MQGEKWRGRVMRQILLACGSFDSLSRQRDELSEGSFSPAA